MKSFLRGRSALEAAAPVLAALVLGALLAGATSAQAQGTVAQGTVSQGGFDILTLRGPGSSIGVEITELDAAIAKASAVERVTRPEWLVSGDANERFSTVPSDWRERF